MTSSPDSASPRVGPAPPRATPALGRIGWTLVLVLSLNAVGKLAQHLTMPELCAGFGAHGLLDHVKDVRWYNLLAAAAVVLLLLRHRWALPACLLWAAHLVFVCARHGLSMLEWEQGPDAVDLVFLLALPLALALVVGAGALALRRRGVLG